MRRYHQISLGVQKQVNSEWHPAVYKGLTIGRSTRREMIRVFGEAKSSEVFDAGQNHGNSGFTMRAAENFRENWFSMWTRRGR